jgi:hypothetical protein
MPQHFLSSDRNQPLLLPPDLCDWLPEDNLAWFVIEAIDELELEPFYASYRSDGHGRAAHEPKMMVTRVNIARFRVRHQEALAELFGQVLVLSAEACLIPAYNAQAVTTEEQLLVAAEISIEGGNFEQLDPMIRAAERELEGAGEKERPEMVPAGAGYWSNDQIDSLRERGVIPIVAPRHDSRPAAQDAPRRTVRLHAKGARHQARWGLYSKRMPMVEPVFAQIKSNRRIAASNEEAGPLPARNGALSPPPTTS